MSSRSSQQQPLSSRGTKPEQEQQKAPTNGIFVAQKTEIKGNVIFGNNCIVHPGCCIMAEGGDIIFGEYNIIEEKVRIINKVRKDEATGKMVKKDMHIGSFNVFEVASQIDSTDIGDLNEFQHKCVVRDSCKIGDYCQINPCVTVPAGTNLESYSVVYDDGKIRKNQEPNEEAKKVSIKELCAFLVD